MKILDSGLLQKWYNRHLSKEDKCDFSYSSVGYFRTAIKDAIGAFFALAMGIIVACLVFGFEMIKHRVQQVLLSIS